MKIDRLLGIIIMLSRNDKVTAPQLAARFEVSRRTINRDIETLCMAGIPIATRQGKGGGIYIQQGYKLDKNIFTADELSDVIHGLKALDSVNKSANIERLLEKVIPKSNAVYKSNDSLIIDLASFYKPSISSKIDIIKKSIKASRHIEFTYYSKKGETTRTIETYIIMFKWESWYVYGYCTDKNDFRMFKLNRLWNLVMLESEYKKQEVVYANIDFDAHLTDNFEFEAIFEADTKYRLIDQYGVHCYSEMPDGKLYFKGKYTNYQYILKWILSFGDKVEVISPEFFAEDIANNAQSMVEKYKTK